MDPVTQTPIVILKDVGGDTVLPIWVGVYEANAIALEMEKVSTPRPMTHDLIKNVLTGLEAQVHKVVVTELREDTFYAVIWLERSGEVISVDSRPSDALALALRVDCPIFVDDLVLKNSKLAANMSDRVTTEELRKWLEGLNDAPRSARLGVRAAKGFEVTLNGILLHSRHERKLEGNFRDKCPAGPARRHEYHRGPRFQP